MTTLASIKIGFRSINGGASKIISDMLQVGWHLDDHGGISYLPIGDNDMFDWSEMPLSGKEELFHLIGVKEKANELVGVVLLWKDSHVGVQVLISNGLVRFLPTVNRRVLEGKLEISDVSWYLATLIPPLVDGGLVIDYVEWREELD